MADHGPNLLWPCLGNTTIDRAIHWRFIVLQNIINKLVHLDFFARVLIQKNEPSKIYGNFALCWCRFDAAMHFTPFSHGVL